MNSGDEVLQLLPVPGQRLLIGVNTVIQRGAGLFQGLRDSRENIQLALHPAAERALHGLPAALAAGLLCGAVGLQLIGKIALQQVFVQGRLFPECLQLLCCAGLRGLGLFSQPPQLGVLLRELCQHLPQIDGRSGGGYGIV